MRNLIYFSILSIFVFSSCKKEKIPFLWQVLDTDTQHILYTLSVVNDTVYCFGGKTYEQGIMLKAFGKEIVYSDSVVTKAIYTSCFIHSEKGFIGEYDGRIYTSENAGNTWNEYQTHNWLPIQKIVFFENWGIAVGGSGQNEGVLCVSDNGGISWSETRLERELRAVAIVDSNTALAAGFGVVLRTTNRTQSWDTLRMDGDFFTDVQFIGSTGYLLGHSGTLYKSTNNGVAWKKIKVQTARFFNYGFFNALHFTDTQRGIICGENGLALLTTDGGNSWSEPENKPDFHFKDVWLSPVSNSGYLCGSKGGLVYFEF